MATTTTGFEIHGVDGFDEEPPSVNVPPGGPVGVITRVWGVSTVNVDDGAKILVSDGAMTMLHGDGNPAIAATVLSRAADLAGDKSPEAAEYLTDLLDQVGAEPLSDDEVIERAENAEIAEEELADAA